MEHQLTGLSGWVADVIAALGALGVGLLTLLETVFPPIPSEVILPLAGYLAERGRMELVAVLVAATVGGVLGAVLLYAVTRRLGSERTATLVAKLPLVDRSDVDRAIDWFARNGRRSVLLGRLVPGVRSLISLPAGAAAMPLPTFVLYTTIGTAAWNALLVGAGYALGSQWQRAERFSDWFNYAIYAALVACIAWLVRRRLRQRRAAARAEGAAR